MAKKGVGMKLFSRSIMMVAAICLAGCASNPRIENLSSENRAKVSQVVIFKSKPEQAYQILGEVSGLSCNRNKYQAQDISESEALEGVKIKTVMIGGDAVINTLCQKNSDTDWVNNCWASIKCIGDAIKFK